MNVRSERGVVAIVWVITAFFVAWCLTIVELGKKDQELKRRAVYVASREPAAQVQRESNQIQECGQASELGTNRQSC
jgi:hypothetical protein